MSNRKRIKVDQCLTETDIYKFFDHIYNELLILVPNNLHQYLKYQYTRNDTLIVYKISYDLRVRIIGVESYSVHIGNIYLPNINVINLKKSIVMRLYSNLKLILSENEQNFVLDNLDILNIPSDRLTCYKRIHDYLTGDVQIKLESWMFIEEMANLHKI